MRRASVASVASTADAVRASVACARALGLPDDDPVVLHEGYSVRVHLRPAPVVTRVITEGRRLRPDVEAWMTREVAVASWLAARAPDLVVAPWTGPGGPGPHRAAGLDVTLWEYAPPEDPDNPARLDGAEGVGQAAFGTLLGRLHAALDDVPPALAATLPPLAGPLADVGSALALTSPDVEPLLHRAAAVLVPLALTWPRRVLHGDAHLGNLVRGPSGARFTDFEDVCVGPVEWDLASLTLDDTLEESAVAAYEEHGAVDHRRREECRALRCLQILASLAVGGHDEPELRARLDAILLDFLG